MNTPDKLILFDGICALCHAWVKFVLRYDLLNQFRFTAMQSELGQSVLRELGMDMEHFDTMLYLEHGTLYIKSNAFIRIARSLAWPARSLSLLGLIPTVMRDFLYDRIARHRFSLFGKMDICRLTDSQYQDRFI